MKRYVVVSGAFLVLLTCVQLLRLLFLWRGTFVSSVSSRANGDL